MRTISKACLPFVLLAATLALPVAGHAASASTPGASSGASNGGATNNGDLKSGQTGVTDNDSTAAKPEVVLPSGSDPSNGTSAGNVGTDNTSHKQNAGKVGDSSASGVSNGSTNSQ